MPVNSNRLNPPRIPSLAERETQANIDKRNAEMEVLKLDAEDKRLELSYRKSRAAARRVYDFVGEVHEQSIEMCVDELNDWAERSLDPIEVRLNSPGGSVFDGLMLYDIIDRVIVPKGIRVTTSVFGYGASMGSILSQAGTRRLIGPQAWFMVHEPSTMMWGKTSGIKDEAELMRRLWKQSCDILSRKSNLTALQIARRSERKDWWMSADEAVRHGFFDDFA